ncbi:ATP-dependent DNA helicase [Dichotomopilus funicola]|uniref:SWI/SNF-related matrix-associated actin-dependent regulator of chromatin subfamily A member 3-like 1 n=1 Tax=Dichotomopilus funicola TaxID=1934379 RepID=A0AAN6ZMI5_9PEZI|nr:putative SWI/SNF-related matrix-associated actin-dependent regulator of chromatin subfamily A member 3-like 1 [Dichotomopilus funicola]
MEPSRKRPRRESDEGVPSRTLPVPHNAGQGAELPGLQQYGPDQATIVTSLSTEPVVCYGMVGFSGTYTADGNSMHEESDSFAVIIHSQREFTPANPQPVSGRGEFSSDSLAVVEALLNESSLRLQASCAVGGPLPLKAPARSRRFGPVSLACKVSIILYGPQDLMDSVGEFFQDVDIYLQDPIGCDMDVRYCNPHRLLSLDINDCPMTSELNRLGSELDSALFQNIPGESDVLDVLDAHQDLPEAPQPALIRSLLRKHQKQALTFFLQREAGWNFDPRSADFWDFQQTSQAAFFVNRISQIPQTAEPPEFCGGIVADPMGLGKTLTMIALIAAEKHSSSSAGWPSLILVPPPLLDTWEEQLKEHVTQGGLTWRRHYGKDRLTKADEVTLYDIVISTYETARADWGGGQKTAGSLLFSIPWRRIILDEAHIIRNTKSQISQAVCALDGAARWAITGTPIQNRIGDLAALLKFIRAYPYHDTKRFETDIGQIWKMGNIEEAVNRLRKLSGGLILRRPKTAIELPPRTDLKFPIEFHAPERELYEHVKHQTMAKIEEAFQDGDKGGFRSRSYITVLQRINALRMICDLGLNFGSRHGLSAIEDAQDDRRRDWYTIAQEAFNLERDTFPVVCSSCSYPCDTTAATFAHRSSESSPTSYYAECMRYICSDCAQPYLRQKEAVMCGHTPNHRVAPVSLGWTNLEERAVPSQIHQLQLSSKVTALISQLRWLPVDTKRSNPH